MLQKGGINNSKGLTGGNLCCTVNAPSSIPKPCTDDASDHSRLQDSTPPMVI